MKSLGDLWSQFNLPFGTLSLVIILIVAIIGMIIIGILIIMCIARRRQQKLDDQRTSMDLLEKGRLTLVRDRSLPTIPKPNNDSFERFDAQESTFQPSMALSPHPFQPDEPEEAERSSSSEKTNFNATGLPAISMATEASEEMADKSNKPVPTTNTSAENLNVASAGTNSDLPDSKAPGFGSTTSPKSPGTSHDEFFEAQDQAEGLPSMNSPSNLRKNLGLRSSSSPRNEPATKSGWDRKLFRSKP